MEGKWHLYIPLGSTVFGTPHSPLVITATDLISPVHSDVLPRYLIFQNNSGEEREDGLFIRVEFPESKINDSQVPEGNLISEPREESKRFSCWFGADKGDGQILWSRGLRLYNPRFSWNASTFGTGWYQYIKLSDLPFAMAGLEGDK